MKSFLWFSAGMACLTLWLIGMLFTSLAMMILYQELNLTVMPFIAYYFAVSSIAFIVIAVWCFQRYDEQI